jgi:AAA+ ATPase superfamily predicted ATPase
VGKSELIKEYLRRHGSNSAAIYYSQAIEGPESLQLSQICADTSPLLPDIPVTNWVDFFELLSHVSTPSILILDEFPYLVKTQASLPSLLQKFIDHKRPPNLRIFLLGSSQSMMHDLVLESHAPLYGRADEILHIRPMSFAHFCDALRIKEPDEHDFIRFSMVGGVPHYWQYARGHHDILSLADELYFDVDARLENEPDRLLRDENLVGEQAKALLELVGRGVERPSEMASRMNVQQTSLSKPLAALINTSLLQREIPFGETIRSTKRVIYRIQDPCLRFWYGVYSPHRTRWHRYSHDEKRTLIREHASHIFEHEFRKLFPDAQRYWERDIEIDAVRYADQGGKNLVLSELKFRKIPEKKRPSLANELMEKFKKSHLAKSFQAVPEVVDLTDGLAVLRT